MSTNAARFQDISLNPQKLAGMCGKLKCCLNYEVDNYIESSRRLPGKDVILQTQDADYYLFKTDILAGLLTYSTDKRLAANLETITAERAREIVELNKQGEKPAMLQEDGYQPDNHPIDLLEGESITRFDKAKKKRKRKSKDTKDSSAAKSAKAPVDNGKNSEPKSESPAKKAEARPKGAKVQDKGDHKAPAAKGDHPQRADRKQRQGKSSRPQERGVKDNKSEQA